MKTLLVTSDITYLPQNAAQFFYELTPESKNYIDAILFLEIPKRNLLKSILFLYLAKCFNMATMLLKNLLTLPVDKRIKLAKEKNIPIYYAKSINSPEIIQWLQHEQFDIIINYRTRCIYKKEALQTAKTACINIHHGILPEHRGVFCDLYALYENRAAGFTIHVMNEKVDDGDILSECEVDSGSTRNYMEYLTKSTIQEAQELQKILEFTNDHQRVPPSTKNICLKPRFTKNPNLKMIQNMQLAGLQL